MTDFASLATVKKFEVPAGPTSVPLQVAVWSANSNTDNEGKPTICWIHGNSASSKIWVDQFNDPNLSSKYNLVGIDLPGHGDSSNVPKENGLSEEVYTLQGFADVVSKTIELAGLHAPTTVLIGWSLGGHISIRCIPKLPKLGGFGAHGTPPLSVPIDMSEGFVMGDPSMPILFKPEPYTRAEAELRCEGMFAQDYKPLPEYLIQDVLRRDPEFSRVLPMSIATSTVSELGLLRTTDKPFLLAHGQDERVINGEYLEKIAKAGDLKTLFENKVQVFKKSGHTPQVEATADYNAVVGAFAKHVFGK